MLLISLQDLGESIEKAFGYNGVGLLVVKNIPEFAQTRAQLLPLAGKYLKNDYQIIHTIMLIDKDSDMQHYLIQ